MPYRHGRLGQAEAGLLHKLFRLGQRPVRLGQQLGFNEAFEAALEAAIPFAPRLSPFRQPACQRTLSLTIKNLTEKETKVDTISNFFYIQHVTNIHFCNFFPSNA